MKNPHTVVSELFRSTSTLLSIGVATLEFCYDHGSEDPELQLDALYTSKYEGIQETE